MKDSTKGILACVGGFFFQLVIGMMFIWGAIAPYMTSYYHLFDANITLNVTFILLSVQITLAGVFQYPGTQLAFKIGPKLALVLGTVVIVGGMFASSFVTSYWWFFVLFGVLFAMGFGLTYSITLATAWSYFPNHKGRVTGVMTSGLGFGMAFLSLITLELVNPENRLPEIAVQNGLVTDNYFAEDIANEAPNMLRWVSFILLWPAIIGIILIPPVKESQHKHDPFAPQSLREILTDRTLYVLVFTGFMTALVGNYFLTAYKIYGSVIGHDDEFLSFIGFLANLINGPMRFVWAQGVDMIGFKATGFILYATQLITMGTITFIAEYRILYAIWSCLVIVTQGGMVSIYAAISGQLYGHVYGGKLISVFIMFFGIAGCVMAFLQRYLIGSIGYFNMYMILTATSVISIVIHLIFYKSDNKWMKLREKSLAQALLDENESKED